MAKYQVDFSCGHTETVTLFGPMKDRYSRIEWLEEHGSCPACFRAEKERERDERNAAAKAANADMVSLVGSEKQIAWAETLRRERVDAISEFRAQADEAGADWESEQGRAVSRAIDHILAQAGAGWWIDNRGLHVRELLNKTIDSLRK